MLPVQNYQRQLNTVDYALVHFFFLMQIAGCLCLASHEVLKGLRLITFRILTKFKAMISASFPGSTSRSPRVAEAQLAPSIYDELQLMILNR
jgi:hypothetical protein